MIGKILTLLKADRHSINVLNTDITKNKFKNISSTAFVIIIIGILCYAMGMYANLMAEQLYKQGYTYVMLALMIFVSLILCVVNTIYKSQGVLFVSKDNDLLLALPIEKKAILASRIIKLMLLEYIWTVIILIPSLVVYVYYEGLTLSLIISSIVMLIALPIIPVILGTILGYIATAISSRFKSKNLMQIIASVVIFVVTFYFSFKLSGNLNELINKAQDIYKTLKEIYYPLGLYIECIENLDVLKLLAILAINIVPLILFVLIFSLGYFKIISKLSENHSKSKFTFKTVKTRNVFDTLFVKEMKKYFRSSVYLLNTIVGPMLLIIGAVLLLAKGVDIKSITEDNAQLLQRLNEYMPLLLYMIAAMGVSTANISASSISIEGKNLQLLKSLPINTMDIFLTKAVFHFLIVFVPSVLSVVLAAVVLNLSAIDTMIITISLALSVFMQAMLGIVINLLLPKLDGSEIAIVKQSASSICSIIIGILYAILIIVLMYKLELTHPVVLFGILAFINMVVILASWVFLEKIGVKKFEEL